MNVISTGIPALDQLTGIGGYPCGRITEIVAPEATLLILQRSIPLVVTAEISLQGHSLVGIRTPEDWQLTAFILPNISMEARKHNTAVVFLTTWEQDTTKALKFYASLRIRIERGIARIVKSSLSAQQGHEQDIAQWLA